MTKEELKSIVKHHTTTNSDVDHIMSAVGEYNEADYTKMMYAINNQPIQFLKEEYKPSQRDYFSVNQQLAVDELTSATAKILMEEDIPQVYNIEALKWWAEAEMRFKVLKADALIKALNLNTDNKELK